MEQDEPTRVFTRSGKFTGVAAGELNQLTGQPIELLGIGAKAPVGLQMVIAKANTSHPGTTRLFAAS